MKKKKIEIWCDEDFHEPLRPEPTLEFIIKHTDECNKTKEEFLKQKIVITEQDKIWGFRKCGYPDEK